ncbi:MAG: glycoside hydrolase family 5 protein [Planctomycetes bacterium]|nr:glycoside hydrolase family 5 protein [Planctomycetota bacterium]
MGWILLAFVCVPPPQAAAQGADENAIGSATPMDQLVPETSKVGVNLACGEFGSVPGIYNKDYTYPGARQFEYCTHQGILVVRLPFRWERMQHQLMEPLDPTELARLDEVVRLARQRDIRLLFDLHNYARYDGKLIGTDDVPIEAFSDFWRRFASHFKDESAVFAYGLMNEPHSTQGRWPAAAQAAIDAIRSVDGTHTICACGDGWSGAHSWQKINKDFVLNDPENNLIYEAHQYFDRDNSGRYSQSYDESGAYPTIGVDRLKPFADWLKEHHARGFIGEFGTPDHDPRWLVVLDNFLAAMKEAQIGGTYWAAGPWWNDYPLSIEPRSGMDRPQMAVLQQYTGSGKSTEKPWLAAAAAAEEAARELKSRGAKVVYDLGDHKESYHYSNEDSEFRSESAEDDGRMMRKITYRHRGQIAWVGFGLYFGELDCSQYTGFQLEIRSDQLCKLEVKAYSDDKQSYVGVFDVDTRWQVLDIPFTKLIREGATFDATRKLLKIEFQPNRSQNGNRVFVGRFILRNEK